MAHYVLHIRHCISVRSGTTRSPSLRQCRIHRRTQRFGSRRRLLMPLILSSDSSVAGSSFKFSCERFLQLTAEQKKLGLLTHLSGVFFGWQTLRSASFFFFTLKKSPHPPLPSPSSHHFNLRQQLTRCNGRWHSTEGGLLAKTVDLYGF